MTTAPNDTLVVGMITMLQCEKSSGAHDHRSDWPVHSRAESRHRDNAVNQLTFNSFAHQILPL